MNNPGLPNTLWNALDQRLWHATGLEGLRGILTSGQIAIAGARYKNSLCRYLNCVSLFDFGPSAVDDWDQFRNWYAWFGHEQNSRVAIWLEVDRETVVHDLYDAGKLHRKWKEHLSKRFIPGVEAGHKGPIRRCALKGALLIDRHNKADFKLCDTVDETLIRQFDDFNRSLPVDPEREKLEALYARLSVRGKRGGDQ
ncbi:MAG: hypothetical protein OXF11_08585 [Deltaproteobacteria bacterium]|nr:hypothetical protein [Deltaproteobacteria bacterium]